MNRANRIKMIAAMEFIVRNINDETILDNWLMDGVADGDICYGNMTPEDGLSMDCYIEDDNFSQIMNLFLHCMSRAKESGGLYCDGVVSKD